jgi:hypothetical protein
VAAGSVLWQGTSYYLHGANVPWFNWGCDFGCGASSGVSNATVNSALDARFAQAQAAGMHAIRWWTFEGNAWQIRTDASGTPTSVDPAVYADFDAALALAAKYDLYFDFVLFNSPTAVQTGWVTDPTKRAALTGALAPLFAHYRANPRVLSWEIFNEPEWDIWGGKIDQASVQATVSAVASAVHGNSNAYVTVGSAMLDGVPMWKGQGLDYYQAHWYDYMSSGDWCAVCTDYPTLVTKYGLDRPLVIGEMYAGNDTAGRFTTFFQRGYAGAWAWSLFPNQTSDRLAVDLTQATTFAAAKGSRIGPRAGSQTVPFPTVPPTAVPTLSPTSAQTAAPTTAPVLTAPHNPTPPIATSAPVPGGAQGGTANTVPVATIDPNPAHSMPSAQPANVPAAARAGGAAPAAAQSAPSAPQVISGRVAPNALAFHATWSDQSAYPALQPGQVQQVTMRFRNTGTSAWVKGVVGEQANLGVYGNDTPYVYRTADDFFRAMATDPAAGMSFDNGAITRALNSAQELWTLLAQNWPTADRAAIQTEDVVKPGQIGTFTFKVRAPAAPGVYLLRLRPVIDGTVWMEDQGAFIIVTSLADYHSHWESQSAYPTVRVGTVSAPITVRYRNTGSLSWVKGVTGQQVNLGVTGEDKAWSASASAWPTADRVAVQSESSVLPGQAATFTFRVFAPSTPGTYTLRLRPVVDGTMWLEDEGVFIQITVLP